MCSVAGGTRATIQLKCLEREETCQKESAQTIMAILECVLLCNRIITGCLVDVYGDWQEPTSC